MKYLLACLFLVSLLFIGRQDVHGDTCSTPYVAASYATPYVAAPIISVPLYSYVNTPGYVQYVPSLSGATQQDQMINQIADAVIRRLEVKQPQQAQPQAAAQQAQSQQAQPQAAPDHDWGPPAVKQSVKPQPTASTTSVAPAASEASNIAKAISIMTQSCAGCHKAGGVGAQKMTLFDDNRQIAQISRERRWDVYDTVFEGRMPKDGQPLPDADVDLIRQWARQK